MEDYAPGDDLHWYLERVASTGIAEQFGQRLTDVAWFLADLHNRSGMDIPTNACVAADSLNEVTDELASWTIIPWHQRQQLAETGQRWLESGVLEQGYEVLIHGDATPTQFFFPREHDLTVIDLESLRPGDRPRTSAGSQPS